MEGSTSVADFGHIRLKPGGGGGGTLIISCIRRLGSFFWVQNFEFLWVFRKINIFLGMKILWIFFRVITKLDYILGSFLNILGSFLKVKVQNGGYFFGLLKFQIFFFWCLKFLIFFWVKGRCWTLAYVCRKMRVPPPLLGFKSHIKMVLLKNKGIQV